MDVFYSKQMQFFVFSFDQTDYMF